METKKNPSVDLTKKSGYYFSIGLFLSTAFAVMAFEWRQRDEFIILKPYSDNHGDPLLEIPITKVDPPPAAPIPIKINPVFVEVKEEEIPDVPFVIDDGYDSTIIVPVAHLEQPAEEGPDIMLFPEESASPKGGFEAFYKYVSNNIKYPAQARRMGVEGRVFVEFVINKDGTLTDVKAIKGIGAGCDEEAVRITQAAPTWNPGKQRGKPVRQRYTLPVIFKLQ